MYTQCPKCSTVFRVQEEQIARHRGLVRCGTCRETFNAAWNEVNNLEAVRTRTAVPAAEPPPSSPASSAQPRAAKGDSRLWKPLPPLTPPAPIPRAEAPSGPEAGPVSARTAPPALIFPEPELDTEPVLPIVAPATGTPPPSAYEKLRSSDPDAKPGQSLPPTAPITEEEPDTVEEIVLESHDTLWEKADQHPLPGSTPSGAPLRNVSNSGARAAAQAPARRQRALAWTLAALVLLAIAIWQIGFFYFDALAQSPRARPILEAMCAVFRCQVPERRQLSTIDVSGASIAYHEEIPGALKIAVNLVNRAPFPQAEPTLQVTLTDKDARIVSRRAYKPGEYRRERTALEPNVVTLTTLELASPPENAVGYEIELFD